MSDQAESEQEYDSYEMSVPATWSKTFETRLVTVYGSRRGQQGSDVVARGVCRLRHLGGEPLEVRVAGFRNGFDWDKLNTGMGPGEWVCTAYRTGE